MAHFRFWGIIPALLLAASAAAQTYEPGLLVRANGDTLRGEIANEFWREPPAYIRFRPSPTAASELLQPRQLRAVQLTGGRYFRYEALTLDHAATTNADQAGPIGKTDFQTDSLLAEVLLDGPVLLWRVVRPSSTHYLLRRPGQAPIDLRERKYLRETASGKQLVEGNNYRDQLRQYFGDCPAAVAATERAAFSPAGLGQVVQAFAACQPGLAPSRSWLAPAAARRRTAMLGGVVAGVRYNYFHNGTELLPATQPCADCQPRPFAGLYTDLLLPGRSRSLYGELSVSQFSNQRWDYVQLNSTLYYSIVDYRSWLLSARLGLRFFFPLPHEQQWLLGLTYELNKSFRPTITAIRGQYSEPERSQLNYELPSLLPNLSVGWRTGRFTASLDGQLYTRRDDENGGMLVRLVGRNFVARGSLAYRLGRHPDAAPGPAPTR